MAVTYEYPVAGAPPTVATVADSVAATVIEAADAAATDVITHAFGLTVAQLAAGQPEVILIPLTPFAILSAWTVPEAQRLTNTVRVDKANVMGSGNAAAQLRVILKRPHSIGR